MTRWFLTATLGCLVTLGLGAPALAQDHGDEPSAEHEGEHGDEAQGEGEHGEGPAAHGGHGDGHLHLFSPRDGVIGIFAMLFNFGVLAAILYWLGRKPLAGFLEARHFAIRDALAEAQKTRAEAEARFKEYSTRLDHLDRELARLREEMKTVAESERDRIVADAEERGARLGREADFLLAQELKQVRKDLERELAAAAVGAAEETLRKVTTEQDQVRLAESYLDVLGEQTKETSA